MTYPQMARQTLQTRRSERATAAGLSGREAVAAAFALACEAIVVLLAFSSDVPIYWTILFHVLTALTVGVILFSDRRPNEDLTVAALMFLVILVSGPAGAFASLVALAFVDHAGAGPHVLDAWYHRLSRARHADAATEMSDRVLAGRVLLSAAPTPQSFEAVIANGTLAERQAALGLMARHFHTDFAPALLSALRCCEPVVRVQASAVVARVRAELKARIKALVIHREGTRDQSQLIANASELIRLSGCALVDRPDAERSRRAAAEALHVALVTSNDVRTAALKSTDEVATVIERYLLSVGRAADFRASRRIHRLTVDRRYRVRRGIGRLVV